MVVVDVLCCVAAVVDVVVSPACADVVVLADVPDCPAGSSVELSPPASHITSAVNIIITKRATRNIGHLFFSAFLPSIWVLPSNDVIQYIQKPAFSASSALQTGHFFIALPQRLKPILKEYLVNLNYRKPLANAI